MFKKTFSNKLRLLLIPLKNTSTVTVLVLIKVGSKYETKRINGISHFLEHLFFKGTKKRPSKIDIGKEFDSIGGEYNAFTSQEYTGFYAKVNFAHSKIALDVLSDMLLNSKFNSEDIDNEKNVIIEEINMYQDMPMEYVDTLWHKLLYGDQPAGWDIAGTKTSVGKINRNDILNFYKKYYTAGNIVISVSGNLDAAEKIMAKGKVACVLPARAGAVGKGKAGNYKNLVRAISDYFCYDENISGENQKEKVKILQSKPEIFLKYKKTDQTHLRLGVLGYDMFNKDRFAIKLLSIILGGGMSSRLFLEIRENRGLAYYVYTRAESDSDSGYLLTGAGLDNNKVLSAVEVILAEYRKIKLEGVSAEEFKKAKNYLKGKMSLNLESSDEWANFTASQELLRKEVLSLNDIFAKIDKVRQDDIQRVANDIFTNNKLNMAIIGPFKDVSKFKRILKI